MNEYQHLLYVLEQLRALMADETTERGKHHYEVRIKKIEQAIREMRIGMVQNQQIDREKINEIIERELDERIIERKDRANQEQIIGKSRDTA